MTANLANQWPSAPRLATSSPEAGAYRGRLTIINRDWGDNKRLDLIAQPEAFVTWRDRALGHLAKCRPDVRRLLIWAEKQTIAIDTNGERFGAHENGVTEDANEVSYILFEGIKHIISDNLLSRARLCGDGCGLDLWRRLHSEWQGAAPQVVAAKARRFQDPARCGNILQLWEIMPAWEQLGEEVIAGGLPMPDWLRANALEKLLPNDMVKTIVGRPELADYHPKMSWVRAQMEHAKSNARADSLTPARKKDAMDVDMGNFEKESGEYGEPGPQFMEYIANAIYAISKGKGKGKGGGNFAKGGKPGKGNPKGGKPGNLAGGEGKGGKSTFEGSCHHCGKYGHRKNECRTLDAEMAKKAINNVDDSVDGQSEGSSEPAPAPEAEEDVWWMGAPLCSIRPETTSQDLKGHSNKNYLHQSRRSTICTNRADQLFAPIAPFENIVISHRFDALQEEDEGPTPRESILCPIAVKTARAPASSPISAEKRREEGQKAGSSHHLEKDWEEKRRKKRKYVRFDMTVDLLTDDRADFKAAVGDQTLNALGTKTPGAVLIEAVVDSGAADPVARAGTFAGKTMPSVMSKAGRKYRGPDGTCIPNEGQQQVQFASDEGHQCGMTWQIADVERPLLAVSHLSAAGNKVVFGKAGGEIINIATGKKIAFQRRGGVYVLRMWVPGPNSPIVVKTAGTPAAPFRRPVSS
jgi:hypothetical protein